MRQPTNPYAELILALQERLAAAFAEAVAGASRYALLDFPNHYNIGDSAIYLGEAILSRAHFGRPPSLVTEADEAALERIAVLDPQIPLLLHGGGNFGDLYPRHQSFREKVLSRFPERKIVILPQSVHFEDEANAIPIARAIARHSDCTLMVRDRHSLRFAESRFDCRTILVPDMAFAIGPIRPSMQTQVEVVALLREDIEAVADPFLRLEPSIERLDWPHEDGAWSLGERAPKRLRRVLPPLWQGRRPVTPAGFERLSRQRVDRGIAMLSRGTKIVTDRLHGHILSILLGKRHVVLDNSYGKISRFMEAWTHGSALQETSFTSALATARQL